MTEQIEVALIDTGFNYREQFDGIEELAAEIKVDGLLQPLVVRPHGDDGRYALIAGERRLRSVRLLGWTHVECNVRADITTDRDAAWLTLLENEQRRNPNAMEQAAEYAEQIDTHGRSVEEIATAIGRKQNYVRDRLALLDCSAPVQGAIRTGAFPMSQALSIADLDHNRQAIAVRDYMENPGWTAERYRTRVDELRQQQAAEAQQGFGGDDFMQVEVYVIEDVNPRRKIGVLGMARILERIRAEVELPAGIQPLVDKAIDDHLGEKAQKRRDAAHAAWHTMRTDKQEKSA